MNILIISLSSAIERRNFQQIQMEKLKLDFEFLEATSIHDIDMWVLIVQSKFQLVQIPCLTK
jgi:GR25 family glycosyltransferase involved in LPS biosynthesis